MAALEAHLKLQRVEVVVAGIVVALPTEAVLSRGKIVRWTYLSSTNEVWKMTMTNICKMKKTQAIFEHHNRLRSRIR